ncbi:MAG TPA: cytochrome c [Candidatus Limnocylindria bacterium]|nr:cytochrome c [Candidatus Limnocylindria bacterium]
MIFPISRQGMQDIALFLIAGAALFLLLALVTRYRGDDWRRFAISAGALGVLVIVSYALAFTVAPNIPTPPVPFTARFLQNPTPDTPETIDRGRALFLANCAICHGPRGLGDGPQAFLLQPRPVNLQLHVPQHASGEIYYWISEGVAGTGMPAWKEQRAADGSVTGLSETQRWEIVRFLQALASGKA